MPDRRGGSQWQVGLKVPVGYRGQAALAFGRAQRGRALARHPPGLRTVGARSNRDLADHP